MSLEADDFIALSSQFLENLSADKAAALRANDDEQLQETLALTADIEAARQHVGAKAAQRRELRQRAAKHAAILPECIRLREECDAALREIEPANQRYLAADKNLQFARDRLAQHVANPPPESDYPSPARIRRWNLEKQRLEGIVEERRTELVARKAEQVEVTNRHFRLTREFAAISLTERQLRPPEQGPKVAATAWRAVEGPEVTGIGPNR